MSTTGATSSVSGGGGGGGGSEGSSSNYNYLSYFATGSYGRKLEGKRSRDPTIVSIEEEKRRWKWIAGIAIAFMCLTNLVVTVGLMTWKYRKTIESTAFEGNLESFIHSEMKDNLGNECRPRYRKTKECSIVSAQLFLVVSANKGSVVWTDEIRHKEKYNFTRGAFQCPGSGLQVDKSTGRFGIASSGEGFYEIHSHITVHNIPVNSTFHHEIHGIHFYKDKVLASERQSWDCTTSASSGSDSSCFSSVLLLTEYLYSGDIIYVELKIDDKKVSPVEAGLRGLLVLDGCSSYFGIIKQGVKN